MEIKVKKRNGRLEDFNAAKVNKCAERACEGLDGTSASELILEANVKLFDKIRTSEIDAALIEAAKQMFSKDPNYSYVASRLLVSCIYKEVLKESVDCDTFAQDYQGSFIKNIKAMVKAGYADPALLKMDLKRLASAIDPDRDFKFKYLGIRNLKDRYMFKLDDKTVELPQAMFMRVAKSGPLNFTICIAPLEQARLHPHSLTLEWFTLKLPRVSSTLLTILLMAYLTACGRRLARVSFRAVLDSMLATFGPREAI